MLILNQDAEILHLIIVLKKSNYFIMFLNSLLPAPAQPVRFQEEERSRVVVASPTSPHMLKEEAGSHDHCRYDLCGRLGLKRIYTERGV
jgi:hypothetical protein